jgi:hypothetical protein
LVILTKAKYLSRKKVNGKWRYIYETQRKKSQNPWKGDSFEEALAARHKEYEAKKGASKKGSPELKAAQEKIYSSFVKKMKTSMSYRSKIRSSLAEDMPEANDADLDDLIAMVYPKGAKSVTADEVEEAK